MATTTIGSFLMYKDTTYKKLCDITDYPVLINPPEGLDASDMSSKFKKYVQGMIDAGAFAFKGNYDKSAMDTINGLNGIQNFALYHGTPDETPSIPGTGTPDVLYWKGTAACTEDEGTVNSVRKMTITFYPSTLVSSTEPS